MQSNFVGFFTPEVLKSMLFISVLFELSMNYLLSKNRKIPFLFLQIVFKNTRDTAFNALPFLFYDIKPHSKII